MEWSAEASRDLLRDSGRELDAARAEYEQERRLLAARAEAAYVAANLGLEGLEQRLAAASRNDGDRAEGAPDA